jgi:hypothetical protein
LKRVAENASDSRISLEQWSQWHPRHWKGVVMVSREKRLLVCLNKRQYLPVTAGWLAHLAILQGTLPAEQIVDDPLVGSWAKSEVVIVSGGLDQQPPAVRDLLAIYALEGREAVTMSRHVHMRFRDIGKEIGRLIAEHEVLQEFCFRQMALPLEFSWLTLAEARRILRGLQDPLGVLFIRKYKQWLGNQPGVTPELRGVLERSGSTANLASFLPQQVENPGRGDP